MVFRGNGTPLCRVHSWQAGNRRQCRGAGNAALRGKRRACPQNRGTLAARRAEEFIAELQSLNISADPQSAARIFTDVHRLALTYSLTSYDAAYLELALRRGLPLATLDDGLIRASRAARVSVVTMAA